MERGRSFMKKWSKVKKMLEDDCLCAVSYTHLDVYKRQIEYGANDLGFDLWAFWLNGSEMTGGGVIGGTVYFA